MYATHTSRTPCTRRADGVETADDADAAESRLEREVCTIAEESLDEWTELRYEQYISPANIQWVKDGAARITAHQTEAVKRAIQPYIASNVDLDELIDPIMEATERYQTAKLEARGRSQRQSYRVTPVRRSLGTHPVEHDVGGGTFVTRDEELFVYDIPL